VSTYLCERAWLGGPASEPAVLIETEGARITAVRPSYTEPLPEGTTMLRGLTVPGLANAHSHAFHRALRGRTHDARGTFWSWRELMYAVADRLDPASMLALARAVYAEMALAGITAVAEFHYLHHGPGGKAYDDPNEMGHAMVAGARAAGIRVTLVDTCYLTGGIGRPLSGAQLRFGDGDAERWAERVDSLAAAYTSAGDVTVGAAVHSVRAVPPDGISTVAAWAARSARPLHVHLSEQVAENEATEEAYGRTPTRLLADNGALGPATTVVHATHLTDDDVVLLGATGTGVCLCPTTERDLADGVGPAPALVAAGSALSLGSDSQAVVDLFEEARGVELDERLAGRRRGTFSAEQLLSAATAGGHAALGHPGDGRIAPGSVADLVSLRLDSVRTAGAGDGPATAVFAASAADVTDVVVGGRAVVRDGRHLLVDDVPGALADAVRDVTG
jgi:formiminoglutamate deiminase